MIEVFGEYKIIRIKYLILKESYKYQNKPKIAKLFKQVNLYLNIYD